MHKETKIINCSNTKHYTPELFRKALTKAFWDHSLNEGDPNIMSEKWPDQFTEILDQIAPPMSRKIKNSYAPSIDKELRQKMLLYTQKMHTRSHKYFLSITSSWKKSEIFEEVLPNVGVKDFKIRPCEFKTL